MISKRKSSNELKLFIFIGLLTVFLDYFIYSLLAFYFFFYISFSKALGFIGGTIFSYVMNSKITFGKNKYDEGSILRFLTIYSFSLLVNVISNNFFLVLFESVISAYLIATFFSALLNFLGMKFYVFNEKK